MNDDDYLKLALLIEELNIDDALTLIKNRTDQYTQIKKFIQDRDNKTGFPKIITQKLDLFNDNNLKKQLSNDYMDRKLQIKLNNDLAKQVLNFQNINRKPIKQGKQKIQ